MSSCELKLMLQNDLSPVDDFSFFKNIFLVIFFFVLTPLTLGISTFSLYSLKKDAPISTNTANDTRSQFSGIQVYASLPGQIPSISGNATSADARPEIIKKYLESYDSPLAPFSNLLVQTTDKYSLDYRLLVAIAQQESNLCKAIPENSYNCWGWGINSQSNLSFKSFQDGIETVAKGLKIQYYDKGYKTVDEIMSKYNPVSPDGAWAKGVSSFMSEME